MIQIVKTPFQSLRTIFASPVSMEFSTIYTTSICLALPLIIRLNVSYSLICSNFSAKAWASSSVRQIIMNVSTPAIVAATSG